MMTTISKNTDIFPVFIISGRTSIFYPKETLSYACFGNRSTLLFTFALNNHISHNQVFGFHLINLLLHSLLVILIYFILNQTLHTFNINPPEHIFSHNQQKYINPIRWHSFPLVCALLFAVHPLATDSVTYISSRSTLLMAFFYLLCVYGFFQMLQPQSYRYPLIYRTLTGAGLLIGFYLSLTSKLTAATLPVMLLVFYFFITTSDMSGQFGRRLWNKKTFFWALLVLLVPIKLASDYVGLDFGMELFGQFNYFLVQFKVITFYYLKMFLWPINQNIDIGFPLSFYQG